MKKTGDPEASLKSWILKGVPLGIEKPIEGHGVYPSRSTPKVCGVRDARRAGANGIDNYVNFLFLRLQAEDRASKLTEF